MMRLALVAVLAVTAAACGMAAAAEPELMAAVQVMGYGYKVKVLVNGTDIGVQGGKSEGRRLFNKGHPMSSQATPDVRARVFVLVSGTNDVSIEYSKLDPKNNDELEVTVEAEGYPQPLLKLVNRAKASDKIAVKVPIEARAPANFKPILLGEAK
jgi:hypothetical protein